MLLSLEIPLQHISEFLPLTDFPFGLAHLALRDANYCDAMKGCLLDNSMYELGETLPAKSLVEAAECIEPLAVIAPDWKDQTQDTLAAAVDLMASQPPGSRWHVGALVQGENLEERIGCFRQLQEWGCRPIGFPFRSPREETITWLDRNSEFRKDEWYHLFGLRDLKELSYKLPGKWSIDTGKPFKGFKLNEKEIRGHGKLSLHSTLSEQAHRVALWNIAYIRRLMNG